jgi:hypothetical protein
MAVASLVDFSVLDTAVNSLRSITVWTLGPGSTEDLANSSLSIFNAILVESDAFKIRFVNSGALQQISRLILLAAPGSLVAPETFIIGCCQIMTIFNDFDSQSSQMQILLATNLSSYRAFQFAFVFALQSTLMDSATWTPVAVPPSLALVEALITCLAVAPFGANPIGAVGIYYYSSYRVDRLAIQACTFFYRPTVDPALNSLPIALGTLKILQFFASVAMVSDMLDIGPFIGPSGPYPLPNYSILPSYAPPFVQPGVPLTAAEFKLRQIAEPMISEINYILETYIDLDVAYATRAFNSLENLLSQSTYVTWTNGAPGDPPNLITTPEVLIASINRQFTDAVDKTQFITPASSGSSAAEAPVSFMIQEACAVLLFLSTLNSLASVTFSVPLTDAVAQACAQMSNYFLGLVSASLVNVNVSIYTSEIQNIRILQKSLINIVLQVCQSWSLLQPIVVDFGNFFCNPNLTAFTVGNRTVQMLSPLASLGIYMSGGLNMQDNLPTQPQEGSGTHHLFAFNSTVVNTVFPFVLLVLPNSVAFPNALELAIPDPGYAPSYVPPNVPPYSVPYNVTVPLVLPTGPYAVPQTPFIGSVWFYVTAYVGLNTMTLNSLAAQNAAASVCQLIRHFGLQPGADYYKKWFLYWNAIALVSNLLQSTNTDVIIQAQKTLASLATP